MDLFVCGSNAHNQLAFRNQSSERDDIYHFTPIISGENIKVLLSEWSHTIGKSKQYQDTAIHDKY